MAANLRQHSDRPLFHQFPSHQWHELAQVERGVAFPEHKSHPADDRQNHKTNDSRRSPAQSQIRLLECGGEHDRGTEEETCSNDVQTFQRTQLERRPLVFRFEMMRESIWDRYHVDDEHKDRERYTRYASVSRSPNTNWAR